MSDESAVLYNLSTGTRLSKSRVFQLSKPSSKMNLLDVSNFSYLQIISCYGNTARKKKQDHTFAATLSCITIIFHEICCKIHYLPLEGAIMKGCSQQRV